MPHHKHPDGYEAEDFITTLVGCKEACMETAGEESSDSACVAIDFINGVCYFHYGDTYDRNSLINDNKSTHYYVDPC